MAYNDEYRLDFESRNHWRWRLAIRTATPNVVAAFNVVTIPPDAIECTTITGGYPSRPVGMADPMTATYVVSQKELSATAPLRYLRDMLRDTCVIVDGVVHLNAFILTCDYGDAGLSYASFKTVAVTTQKPTYERAFDLDDPFMDVTLETVDLMKVVLELTEIPAEFSRADVGQYIAGVAVEAPRVYEWYKIGYKRRIVFDGVTRMVMRNAADAWLTIAGYQAKIAGRQMLKDELSNTLIGFELGDSRYYPFDHITWYDQANDTDIDGKTAVASTALWWCMAGLLRDGTLTGFEHKSSAFSPVSRYDNWWNYMQVVSESQAGKSRLHWRAGVPRMETVAIWDGWIAAAPAVLDWADFTIDGCTSGHEVLKAATVTVIARTDQTEGETMGDITEFEAKSRLSITDEEVGIKEIVWDMLPEARGERPDVVLAGTGGGPAEQCTQRRVWFNYLYSYTDGRFVRLHHHNVISDGIDTYEGPPVHGTLSPTLQLSTQAAIIRKIQEDHGGLPLNVARAIYGSFGRMDQTLLEVSCDARADLMPMEVGTPFTFNAPADIVDVVGDVITNRAILTKSSFDVAECELTLSFFIRGMRDPL